MDVQTENVEGGRERGGRNIPHLKVGADCQGKMENGCKLL
jgi:hypothetical protein